VSPDEVIIKLELLGVKMTRRTLLNYEKWGLIPKPERGGGGPGGRFADYPDRTIEETYAAWSLMHGEYGGALLADFFGGRSPRISPNAVKTVRFIDEEFEKRNPCKPIIIRNAEEMEKFNQRKNRMIMLPARVIELLIEEIGGKEIEPIFNFYWEIWKREKKIAKSKTSE